MRNIGLLLTLMFRINTNNGLVIPEGWIMENGKGISKNVKEDRLPDKK